MCPESRISVLSITLALLVLAPVETSSDFPILHPGDTLERVLEEGDPALHEVSIELEEKYDEPAEAMGVTYSVVVETSGTYHVDLTSLFFDAYLLLRDESGVVLAEDDDGLLGKHSRIVTRLEAGHPYILEACALRLKAYASRAHFGEFTLSLEAGKPASISKTERAAAELADARETLAVREEAFGETSVRVADSLSSYAAVLYGRGDFSPAEQIFRRELELRENLESPRTLGLGTALLNLATVLQQLGRYSDAEAYFVRALEVYEAALDPGHPYALLALNGVGISKYLQGEYTEAGELLERALNISERAHGPRSAETAALLGNVALTLEARADLEGARDLYLRALEIHESDHLEIASVCMNLSRLSRALGDYEIAREYSKRGSGLFEKLLGPWSPETAKSLGDRGLILLELGEYEAALPLLERALSINERALGPRHPDTAASLNNLGVCLLYRQEDESARPYLERALLIWEEVLGSDHPLTATCFANLALAQSRLEDFGGARELAERSLAIRKRRLGPEHPHVANSLHALGGILLNLGDVDAAQAVHERELVICERALGAAHPDTGNALRFLGAVLLRRGLLTEARGPLERALEISLRSLGPEHPGTMGDLDSLLSLESEVGNDALAYSYGLRLCDGGLGWIYNQIGLAPGVRRFEVAGGQEQRLDLLLSALAQLEDAQSHLDEVFGRVASWQGLVFRHTSRLARVFEAGGGGPRVRELRSRLRLAEGELARLAYTPHIEDVADHRARFEALRRERERAEREFLAELGVDPQRERTSAAELGALLPEGSALVVFQAHRPYRFRRFDGAGQLVEEGGWQAPRTLCWIVTAGAERPLLVDLGPEEQLREALPRYLTEITPKQRGVGLSRPRGVVSAAAAALRERLWEPLSESLAGTRQLFVVTDGFLAELPLGALMLENGHYLLEDVEIVYAQDPVTLRERLERAGPQRNSAPSVLALGGVDYSHRAEAPAGASDLAPTPGSLALSQSTRGLRSFSQDWPPLAETLREADAVLAIHAELFPGAARTRLVGAEATEEAFALETPGTSILHIATHGFYEREGVASLWQAVLAAPRDDSASGLGASLGFPERLAPVNGVPPGLLAGLVLAGVNESAPTGRADGVLSAEEVVGLDLSACNLAVLSACQTALGSGRSGEGLVSLRRSFREAGVETVIASLWKVDDEATRVLFARFYDKLWRENLAPSAALRSARLSLLRDGRFAAPRYWAAFTLSGDWR